MALATFVARPGDAPRTTAAIARRLDDLRVDSGAELVTDLLDLTIHVNNVAEKHAVSRSGMQRERAMIFGLRFEPRYDRWLSSGRTQAAIAAEFGLSASTVGHHRAVLNAGISDEHDDESDGSDETTKRRSPARASDGLPAGLRPQDAPVETGRREDGTLDLTFLRERQITEADVRRYLEARGNSADAYVYSWHTGYYGPGWVTNRVTARPKSTRELLAEERLLDLPMLAERVADIRANRGPSVYAEESPATVVCPADWQIGKTGSRGGTPELLVRLADARERLAVELERRKPQLVAVFDLGDGIENTESGGSPLVTNDLSVPQQIDVYAAELFELVKVASNFAPVTVTVVPSNHSAWRRGKQQLGKPEDDYGVAVHHIVERQAQTAGIDATWRYCHPYSESITIDVLGVPIAAAHGHQWGPSGALQWWERQTFGGQPVVGADVLLSGHYHSFAALTAGINPATGRERFWLQAPTEDNGSDWFRNLRGRDSLPGMLMFDVDHERGFQLPSLTIL